jgi:hypothetical protein
VFSHRQHLAEPLQHLLARRPFNVAVVALANRMARTIWALLAHNRTYQMIMWLTPPRRSIYQGEGSLKGCAG